MMQSRSIPIMHQPHYHNGKQESKGSIRIFIQEAINLLQNEIQITVTNASSREHDNQNDKGADDSMIKNESLYLPTLLSLLPSFDASSPSSLLSNGSSTVQYWKIQSCSSFRIMGRIVQIQSYDQWQIDDITLYSNCTLLLIDDGTSFIQLLIPSASLSDGTDLKNGDCIDCIGLLESLIIPRSKNSNIPEEENKKDHEYLLYILLTKSYSNVRDPNVETLRMIELSTRNNRTSIGEEYSFHHYYLESPTNNEVKIDLQYLKKSDKGNNNIEISSDSKRMKRIDDKQINRIYLYNDAITNLLPFQIEENVNAQSESASTSMNMTQPKTSSSIKATNNKSKSMYLQRIEQFHQQQQKQQQIKRYNETKTSKKLSINRDHLMSFIELSKPNGLKEDELMLLLDCHTVEEIKALKDGLEVMRNNFDIYITNTGSYLPL